MKFIETGKIKKPSRSTKGSAGYDFYCPQTLTIGSGEIAVIDTGIIAEIDEGYYLSLHPRSSLYAKGLCIEGIIDSDYNREIKAIIQNRNKSHSVHINAGERFMQGIFHRYYTIDDDDVSDERNGGLGSTGR